MTAEVIDFALERRKRDARRMAELAIAAFFLLFMFFVWPRR